MPKKRPGKKTFRLGLDVGTRFIKAIEVALEGDTFTLTKFQLEKIDMPLAPENALFALKALLQKLNPQTQYANTSLSAPFAIVRFINMPKMKEEDLKNSLRFEAEKYIPFSINDVITDAVSLSDKAPEKNQMKVLLAAAKKDAVNSRIEMLKGAGLSVSVIDVDGFACFNAFLKSQENLDASKSVVLLNIGYTQANVVIVREGEAFFTRDIQIGARDIAKAISKILEVSEEEGEALILDAGDKRSEVTEAAGTVIASLIDELRLSFGYYENQYGKAVSDIYVSGGMAYFKGLLDSLEENFGNAPIIWDPFAKFEIDPALDQKKLEPVRAQFAVAAGLALRG